MPVKVVTDSTADIPVHLVEEWDITVAPCVIIFEHESYLEGVDIDREGFYQKLAEHPKPPTTSQPSAGVFEEIYKKLAGDGDAIVSIHLAASLSGVISSAQMAARALPDISVAVVDSGQISMALGWLVIRAAQMAKEGGSLDEVLALVEDIKPRLRLVAMLDTLEYIRHSGRIGKWAFWLGSALHIKPLLEVREGELHSPAICRSRARALETVARIATSWGEPEEVAIIHANALPVAQRLAGMLSDFYPREKMVFAEASATLVSHTGPGAVGVAVLLKS